MTPTRSLDRRTVWRAVVAVRVPPTDGDDLATSACRRLERENGVAEAALEGLMGVDPTMSATVVTVDVRVEATVRLDDEAVADRLTAAPGAERVDDVQPA
jgi:hypothetical protein